jgi:hypothetical protein
LRPRTQNLLRFDGCAAASGPAGPMIEVQMWRAFGFSPLPALGVKPKSGCDL